MAYKPGFVPPPQNGVKWATIHLGVRLPTRSRDTPESRAAGLATIRLLFGLAPGGVYHAVPVTSDAVGSYPTLSPLPRPKRRGGLLSVALSLNSRLAGITRRPARLVPGLSSHAIKNPVCGRPAI